MVFHATISRFHSSHRLTIVVIVYHSRIRHFYLFWLHHLVLSLPTLLFRISWYLKPCFGILSSYIIARWSFHLPIYIAPCYVTDWMDIQFLLSNVSISYTDYFIIVLIYCYNSPNLNANKNNNDAAFFEGYRLGLTKGVLCSTIKSI